MASSGTFTRRHSGWTLSVQWRVTAQDIDANTSTVQLTPYLICDNSFDLNVSSKALTYNVGGEYRERTAPAINTAGGQTIQLDSAQTFTIAHNADGTGYMAPVVTYRIQATLNGTYVSSLIASAGIYLDTIPRASQPSLITWPETTNDVGDFGDTISIHMNRASSVFTHTVRYAFGNLTGTIATGVETGTTWTIPLSFISLLPSAVEGSGRIYVDTYRGSTFIGTKYTGFTATVPASVKPSCGMTLEDVTGTDDIYGSPVQSLSRIKVTISATQAYSSPIKDYSISIDGARYTTQTVTTAALRTAGSSPVTVTVTDQRGRTVSVGYTMNVQAYNPPAVSVLTVHRCDEDGTNNDQGGYVRVNFSAAISGMSGKNTATYVLRYRKPSDTSWTEVTLSDLANTYTVDEYAHVFPADGNSSYEVEVEASDRHHTTTRATSASTAFQLINWGANGTSMALGKIAEKDNAFEVALDTYFYGSTVQAGNRYAFSTPGGASTTGFIRMVRIAVTAANADTPMTFVFSRRQALAPMTVHVTLTNSTATTSAINKIVYEGANYGAFLVQFDELTWDLYVEKGSAWDTVTLQDWYTSKTMESRVRVTFPGTLVDTVPEPYWRATPAQLDSIRDYIYPVGSVYISYSHADPATMFGGTWVRITNAFLWAVDASGTIGQTGGAKTHTLTVDELPSHSHGSVYSGNVSGTKTHAWLASGGSSMAYGAVPTGGGEAHNNMPPYIQVSVWRRTA